MNFLAHFHLAWPDPGLLAGGLEGDYYKGPLRGNLPADLARGVSLHRAIDAYTDRHPLTGDLRQAFPRHLRRYAGILLDLSFDHFLSRHWERFGELPLAEFNGLVYGTLREREAALSAGSRRMLGRLIEYDMLARYHDWETVAASAARIGERLRRDNPLATAGRDLAPARRLLEQGFLTFYPQLQAFAAQWQRGGSHSPGGPSKFAPGDESL